MTSPSKHVRHAFALFVLTLLASPAFAVSKEMVQLQTQVQALQDAVARLQQSNDERMGVVKDLVQQNADSVNKMSATVETVARSLQTQNEAQGGKLDLLSGQIQSLNDSLDEMKTRLARLEKLTQDIQNQQQSLPAASAPAATAMPSSSPQPDTSLPAAAPTNAQPTYPSNVPPAMNRRGKPSASLPMDSSAPQSYAPAASPASAAASVDDLYKSALGDYMAAKYSLAAGEFADVIRYYPDAPLSGNAFYYLGEIDYRAAKYDEATKDYDMVLQHFPASNKVPPSRLHKGQALMALKQNDAAVREFRALIQRFPTSPEASLARSKLSGMGIAVSTPRRP